jgi:uncharacterized membrane protein YhhN
MTPSVEAIFGPRRTHLLPFFLFSAVYCVFYQPFSPSLTVTTALFKALPVWALVYYVSVSSHKTVYTSWTPERFLPEGIYATGVATGLLFSSVGDICLLSDNPLVLVVGVSFFGLGHIYYLLALGPAPPNSRTRFIFITGAIITCLIMNPGIDDTLSLVVGDIYTILIFAMAWCATARYEVNPTFTNKAAFYGAILFIVSDIVIGVNHWRFPLPGASLVSISTYYAAQLGLAVSSTAMTQNVPTNQRLCSTSM